MRLGATMPHTRIIKFLTGARFMTVAVETTLSRATVIDRLGVMDLFEKRDLAVFSFKIRGQQ